MRRLISFLALALMTVAAMAQQVAENESAIVYYLPKTAVNVVVRYMEIQTTAGPFYQYSERYLGTKDVVTESSRYFEIAEVQVRTKAQADPARAYMLPMKSAAASHISLAKDGQLLGFNLPKEEPRQSKKEAKTSTMPAPALMPLLEEQMLAANKSKMAESTAKQIYRIREARLNLLTGDVDHLPADGRAMQLTLDGLRKQEAALVALFIGHADTIWHTRTLQYVPSEKKNVENVVVGRFSEAQGILNTDNLAGAPIYLSLKPVRSAEYAGGPKGSKPLPTLYYCQPALVAAEVADDRETLTQATLPIAQWGIALPIEQSLLTEKTVIKLTSAGAIESISK